MGGRGSSALLELLNIQEVILSSAISESRREKEEKDKRCMLTPMYVTFHPEEKYGQQGRGNETRAEP